MDSLPEALILVQPGLTVEVLNRAARELLQTCPALRIVAGRLEALDGADLAPLQKLIDRPRYEETTLTDCTSFVVGAEDCRLLVTAKRVADCGHSVWPAGRGVLLSLRLDRPPSDMSDRLRRELGLTPAEARVAVHMLSGCSLREAAQTLGVAYATVRCQVQSIFGKTGTSGQQQLLRLLASYQS